MNTLKSSIIQFLFNRLQKDNYKRKMLSHKLNDFFLYTQDLK